MAAAALFSVWVLVHWVLADRLQTPGRPGARRSGGQGGGAGAVARRLRRGRGARGAARRGRLVSRERERGLQRFLFAKPVNIVRYYLQAFAINSVGSLIVLAGAVLLAAATAPPGARRPARCSPWPPAGTCSPAG
jgi:hypothetical protein